MRRIIERVVTVVTTTTWKISWEMDTPHPTQPAEPAPNRLPDRHILTEIGQSVQTLPTVSEVKEVGPPEIEPVPKTPADKPPQ